jgi:hypothetical protein
MTPHCGSAKDLATQEFLPAAFTAPESQKECTSPSKEGVRGFSTDPPEISPLYGTVLSLKLFVATDVIPS